jgi:dihydroxy-acid dehydratase
VIRLDAQAATLDVKVDPQVWAERLRHPPAASRERLSGVLEKYARLVAPARLGAVTHSGPAGEAS